MTAVSFRSTHQRFVENPEDEQLKNDCLIAHNSYRSTHDVATVDLVAKVATKGADQVVLGELNATSGLNIYSKLFKVGEALLGKEVVDWWYAKMTDYDFGREPNDLERGQFTQLVWRKSHKLGVGKATSESGGRVHVVAVYDPPGNVTGSFSKNVLPPRY